MKMVIAGGRDFKGNHEDSSHISIAVLKYNITEIILGGCRGADRFGQQYAIRNKITYSVFPADWHEFGKAAGPIRNAEMAEYTDYVFLFLGGRGTDSMRKLAKKADKRIIYDNGWIK